MFYVHICLCMLIVIVMFVLLPAWRINFFITLGHSFSSLQYYAKFVRQLIHFMAMCKNCFNSGTVLHGRSAGARAHLKNPSSTKTLGGRGFTPDPTVYSAPRPYAGGIGRLPQYHLLPQEPHPTQSSRLQARLAP